MYIHCMHLYRPDWSFKAMHRVRECCLWGGITLSLLEKKHTHTHCEYTHTHTVSIHTHTHTLWVHTRTHWEYTHPLRVYTHTFHWVKFSQTYFHGLFSFCGLTIIIVVAYCSWLLLQCPDFRGLIFRFWALRNKNKTQRTYAPNFGSIHTQWHTLYSWAWTENLLIV